MAGSATASGGGPTAILQVGLDYDLAGTLARMLARGQLAVGSVLGQAFQATSVPVSMRSPSAAGAAVDPPAHIGRSLCCAVQGMKVLRVGTRGSTAALAANRANPNAPRPWERESGFTNKAYRPSSPRASPVLPLTPRPPLLSRQTADRPPTCALACTRRACVRRGRQHRLALLASLQVYLEPGRLAGGRRIIAEHSARQTSQDRSDRVALNP